MHRTAHTGVNPRLPMKNLGNGTFEDATVAAGTIDPRWGSSCCFVDYDGDGFTADVDCNDDNADIHPDATEIWDGLDNNRDDSIDGSHADGAGPWNAGIDAERDGCFTTTSTLCLPGESRESLAAT